MRHSREEIVAMLRSCQATLGRAPGKDVFCRTTGLKQSEIDYYWPTFTALVQEVGARPNEFQSKLPDEVVFQDFARVCRHIKKIPTDRELRIVQRSLGTKTYTAYKRFGNAREFHSRFKQWLHSASADLAPILEFPGWSLPAPVEGQAGTDAMEKAVFPGLRAFLPASLQYLETLARGERPPFESTDLAPAILFEKRTADAFRCLGFEVSPLGQGTGRNPDALALARRERFAVIIDAKVRTNGYVLGTEDRKFLEYARIQGAELKRQGFENLYFAVVGPSFREGDLKKLTEYLSDSPIRSVAMITASALIRIVEDSIRDRYRFVLSDFGQQLFGNKIIAA